MQSKHFSMELRQDASVGIHAAAFGLPCKMLGYFSFFFKFMMNTKTLANTITTCVH